MAQVVPTYDAQEEELMRAVAGPDVPAAAAAERPNRRSSELFIRKQAVAIEREEREELVSADIKAEMKAATQRRAVILRALTATRRIVLFVLIVAVAAVLLLWAMWQSERVARLELCEGPLLLDLENCDVLRFSASHDEGTGVNVAITTGDPEKFDVEARCEADGSSFIGVAAPTTDIMGCEVRVFLDRNATMPETALRVTGRVPLFVVQDDSLEGLSFGANALQVTSEPELDVELRNVKAGRLGVFALRGSVRLEGLELPPAAPSTASGDDDGDDDDQDPLDVLHETFLLDDDFYSYVDDDGDDSYDAEGAVQDGGWTATTASAVGRYVDEHLGGSSLILNEGSVAVTPSQPTTTAVLQKTCLVCLSSPLSRVVYDTFNDTLVGNVTGSMAELVDAVAGYTEGEEDGCFALVELGRNETAAATETEPPLLFVSAGGGLYAQLDGGGETLGRGVGQPSLSATTSSLAAMATVREWVERGGTDDFLVQTTVYDPWRREDETWLYASKDALVTIDASWLSAFSASLLKPRFLKVRTSLVPAFCPVQVDDMTTEQLGAISDLLRSEYQAEATAPVVHSVGAAPLSTRYRFEKTPDGYYTRETLRPERSRGLLAAIILSLLLAGIMGVVTTLTTLRVVRHIYRAFLKRKQQKLAMGQLQKQINAPDYGTVESRRRAARMAAAKGAATSSASSASSAAAAGAKKTTKWQLPHLYHVPELAADLYRRKRTQSLRRFIAEAMEPSAAAAERPVFISVAEFREKYERYCFDQGFSEMPENRWPPTFRRSRLAFVTKYDHTTEFYTNVRFKLGKERDGGGGGGDGGGPTVIAASRAAENSLAAFVSDMCVVTPFESDVIARDAFHGAYSKYLRSNPSLVKVAITKRSVQRYGLSLARLSRQMIRSRKFVFKQPKKNIDPSVRVFHRISPLTVGKDPPEDISGLRQRGWQLLFRPSTELVVLGVLFFDTFLSLVGFSSGAEGEGVVRGLQIATLTFFVLELSVRLAVLRVRFIDVSTLFDASVVYATAIAEMVVERRLLALVLLRLVRGLRIFKLAYRMEQYRLLSKVEDNPELRFVLLNYRLSPASADGWGDYVPRKALLHEYAEFCALEGMEPNVPRLEAALAERGAVERTTLRETLRESDSQRRTPSEHLVSIATDLPIVAGQFAIVVVPALPMIILGLWAEAGYAAVDDSTKLAHVLHSSQVTALDLLYRPWSLHTKSLHVWNAIAIGLALSYVLWALLQLAAFYISGSDTANPAALSSSADIRRYISGEFSNASLLKLPHVEAYQASASHKLAIIKQLRAEVKSDGQSTIDLLARLRLRVRDGAEARERELGVGDQVEILSSGDRGWVMERRSESSFLVLHAGSGQQVGEEASNLILLNPKREAAMRVLLDHVKLGNELRSQVQLRKLQSAARTVQQALNRLSTFHILLFVVAAISYASLVAIWAVLGAVLNPERFLPFAASAACFVTFAISETRGSYKLRERAKKRISELSKNVMDDVMGRVGLSGVRGDEEFEARSFLRSVTANTPVGAMVAKYGLDVKALCAGDPVAVTQVSRAVGVNPQVVEVLVAVAKKDSDATMRAVAAVATLEGINVDPHVAEVVARLAAGGGDLSMDTSVKQAINCYNLITPDEFQCDVDPSVGAALVQLYRGNLLPLIPLLEGTEGVPPVLIDLARIIISNDVGQRKDTRAAVLSLAASHMGMEGLQPLADVMSSASAKHSLTALLAHNSGDGDGDGRLILQAALAMVAEEEEACRELVPELAQLLARMAGVQISDEQQRHLAALFAVLRGVQVRALDMANSSDVRSDIALSVLYLCAGAQAQKKALLRLEDSSHPLAWVSAQLGLGPAVLEVVCDLAGCRVDDATPLLSDVLALKLGLTEEQQQPCHTLLLMLGSPDPGVVAVAADKTYSMLATSVDDGLRTLPRRAFELLVLLGRGADDSSLKEALLHEVVKPGCQLGLVFDELLRIEPDARSYPWPKLARAAREHLLTMMEGMTPFMTALCRDLLTLRYQCPEKLVTQLMTNVAKTSDGQARMVLSLLRLPYLAASRSADTLTAAAASTLEVHPTQLASVLRVVVDPDSRPALTALLTGLQVPCDEMLSFVGRWQKASDSAVLAVEGIGGLATALDVPEFALWVLLENVSPELMQRRPEIREAFSRLLRSHGVEDDVESGLLSLIASPERAGLDALASRLGLDADLVSNLCSMTRFGAEGHVQAMCDVLRRVVESVNQFERVAMLRSELIADSKQVLATVAALPKHLSPSHFRRVCLAAADGGLFRRALDERRVERLRAALTLTGPRGALVLPRHRLEALVAEAGAARAAAADSVVGSDLPFDLLQAVVVLSASHSFGTNVPEYLLQRRLRRLQPLADRCKLHEGVLLGLVSAVTQSEEGMKAAVMQLCSGAMGIDAATVLPLFAVATASVVGLEDASSMSLSVSPDVAEGINVVVCGDGIDIMASSAVNHVCLTLGVDPTYVKALLALSKRDISEVGEIAELLKLGVPPEALAALIALQSGDELQLVQYLPPLARVFGVSDIDVAVRIVLLAQGHSSKVLRASLRDFPCVGYRNVDVYCSLATLASRDELHFEMMRVQGSQVGNSVWAISRVLAHQWSLPEPFVRALIGLGRQHRATLLTVAKLARSRLDATQARLLSKDRLRDMLEALDAPESTQQLTLLASLYGAAAAAADTLPAFLTSFVRLTAGAFDQATFAALAKRFRGDLGFDAAVCQSLCALAAQRVDLLDPASPLLIQLMGESSRASWFALHCVCKLAWGDPSAWGGVVLEGYEEESAVLDARVGNLHRNRAVLKGLAAIVGHAREPMLQFVPALAEEANRENARILRALLTLAMPGTSAVDCMSAAQDLSTYLQTEVSVLRAFVLGRCVVPLEDLAEGLSPFCSAIGIEPVLGAAIVGCMQLQCDSFLRLCSFVGYPPERLKLLQTLVAVASGDEQLIVDGLPALAAELGVDATPARLDFLMAAVRLGKGDVQVVESLARCMESADAEATRPRLYTALVALFSRDIQNLEASVAVLADALEPSSVPKGTMRVAIGSLLGGMRMTIQGLEEMVGGERGQSVSRVLTLLVAVLRHKVPQEVDWATLQDVLERLGLSGAAPTVEEFPRWVLLFLSGDRQLLSDPSLPLFARPFDAVFGRHAGLLRELVSLVMSRGDHFPQLAQLLGTSEPLLATVLGAMSTGLRTADHVRDLVRAAGGDADVERVSVALFFAAVDADEHRADLRDALPCLLRLLHAELEGEFPSRVESLMDGLLELSLGGRTLGPSLARAFGLEPALAQGLVALARGDVRGCAALASRVGGFDEAAVAHIVHLVRLMSPLSSSSSSSSSSAAAAAATATANAVASAAGGRTRAELFAMLDTDKSGLLDFHEFKAVLGYFGLSSMTQVRTAELFAMVDRDKNGHVDLQELGDALEKVEQRVANSALSLIGLSRENVALALAFSLVVLGLFLTFIFAGILAFSTGSAFGSVINSVLPVLSGGALRSRKDAAQKLESSLDRAVGEAMDMVSRRSL